MTIGKTVNFGRKTKFLESQKYNELPVYKSPFPLVSKFNFPLVSNFLKKKIKNFYKSLTNEKKN